MMDMSVMFMVLGILVLCATVILIQQRSIDRLTSKLMAKDYREYTTSQRGAQNGTEPKMEQLSWYDDPREVKEDTQ